MKWQSGKLKPTKCSPGQFHFEARVEAFLRWCSYGSDATAEIEALRVQGVHVHVALRVAAHSSGPPGKAIETSELLADLLSARDGDDLPASSNEDEDELPPWAKGIGSAISSHNHGAKKCFERITRFAREIYPPPDLWAVYGDAVPESSEESAESVPPFDLDVVPPPDRDLVEGHPFLGLPPAAPIAVGPSPSEALKKAAELRSTELENRDTFWLLTRAD